MVNIAVVGCSHGEIDKIYEVIQNIEQERQIQVKLVLCCGDFQSVRNMTDLRCMNCPLKYQAMHDFHRYYSGEKKAPIPTVFIGGNHEASNFLQELPFGGWVAPNIYFMGYSNVLRFGSLRIAGISGIFKGQDYLKGRYECPPYDQNSIRSTYHYRNLDIFRLKQIKSSIDIVVSHDWPRGIYNYGNVDELLRRKPFFGDEIYRNELGSRPLSEVLNQLEPSYWFSAHMHVRFSATVPFESKVPGTNNPKTTKFLALDKVLPRRQFLQIIEIPCSNSEEEFKLSYDPEWLAILKSTDNLMSTKPNSCFMPGPGSNARYDFSPGEEEVAEVVKLFSNLHIPQNFVQTGPPFVPGEKPMGATPITNSQTIEFCDKLGVSDPLSSIRSQSRVPNVQNQSSSFIASSPANSSFSSTFQEYSPLNISSSSSYAGSFFNQSISADKTNPDEIELDLDEDDDNNPENTRTTTTARAGSANPISSSLENSRRKMFLPPPKSISTPTTRGETVDETRESVNPDGVVDVKELKVLESIFQKDEEENAKSEATNEPLFVIDKIGELSNTTSSTSVPEEPFLKKRRNEALYKELENEAE